MPAGAGKDMERPERPDDDSLVRDLMALVRFLNIQLMVNR